MRHDKAPHTSLHQFGRQGYYRSNRQSKKFCRCESSFYFEAALDHARGALTIPPRGKNVVKTNGMSWEAPPVLGVPPVELLRPESPELSGLPDLGGRTRDRRDVRSGRGVGAQRDARAGRARWRPLWPSAYISVTEEGNPPCAWSGLFGEGCRSRLPR